MKNYVTPQPNDILAGRGIQPFHHPGNSNLRSAIAALLDEYSNATKTEKSDLVGTMLGSIKKKGGRFLKLDESKMQWYDAGSKQCRKKISQAFRDALVPHKAKCREAVINNLQKLKEKHNTPQSILQSMAFHERNLNNDDFEPLPFVHNVAYPLKSENLSDANHNSNSIKKIRSDTFCGCHRNQNAASLTEPGMVPRTQVVEPAENVTNSGKNFDRLIRLKCKYLEL